MIIFNLWMVCEKIRGEHNTTCIIAMMDRWCQNILLPEYITCVACVKNILIKIDFIFGLRFEMMMKSEMIRKCHRTVVRFSHIFFTHIQKFKVSFLVSICTFCLASHK